jgi:glycosyltransferase involved in cell wall biosynthesis
MNVLQVINSLRFGGAERVVTDVAMHLNREHSGVTVEVCTLFDGGIWAQRLEEEGVVIHNIQVGKWNAPLAVARLYKLIAAKKYDIVHAHLWPSLYYTAAASKLARHPAYVYTEHNTFNRRRHHRSLRRLEAGVYSSYEAIVANSMETESALASWAPEVAPTIRVIENGVPTHSVTKPSYRLSAPARLLVVGRLVHYKGIDVAIEAVRLLIERGVGVSMTVLGAGPEEDSLRNRADGLPVEFLGFKDEPQRWMATHDCLIVPSRWEGFGLTAVEGQTVGIPVVVSRIDNLAAMVSDGTTGATFTPEDPADLAKKIAELLTDEHLRRRVSENAKSEALRRWSLDRHISELLGLYSCLVSERAQSQAHPMDTRRR